MLGEAVDSVDAAVGVGGGQVEGAVAEATADLQDALGRCGADEEGDQAHAQGAGGVDAALLAVGLAVFLGRPVHVGVGVFAVQAEDEGGEAFGVRGLCHAARRGLRSIGVLLDDERWGPLDVQGGLIVVALDEFLSGGHFLTH